VFLGAYDLVRDYGGRGTVARRAAVVWTHAEVNVPAIERLGVPRALIRVAYRGVDFGRFQSTGVVKVPRRIVSIGRLDAAKSMHDVLAVFLQVFARWPESTLHLVGDGPELPRLQALVHSAGIQHAVSFRGYVPHARVRHELDAAEVFLFMSRKESERLPNVVKEAMACRCLCVVADSPGMQELLADGITGYIVPPGDVAAAARRIDDLFAGRTEAAPIVDAAFDDVRRRFDARRTMALYERCWGELMEATSSAEPSRPRSNRETTVSLVH
jgi:glycosyltransferase involved in cell wall biosynthesis